MKTVVAVIVFALGFIPAPAGAKAPPGRTLVVEVTGASGARVTVTGPKGYHKTLRVTGTKRLKKLAPGRYTATAEPVGEANPTDAKQKIRVRKNRGATVRFRYPPPDTTAPQPVSNLRVTSLTATTLRLAWDTPADGTFLFVGVVRSGGTDAETGQPVLDPDGKGLSDSGLVPNTEYIYSITAEDEAGNVSAPARITVRTLPG
jgi:chitinase